LWANASDKYRGILEGVEDADSWATDGHKWLNVTYDIGYAFVKQTKEHKASMSMRASYLTHDEEVRDQFDWNPEWSRRGRGVSTYAAIRQFGTTGIYDLIDSSCNSAYLLVERMGKMEGVTVMSLPRITQGLVHFQHHHDHVSEADHDAFTDMVIEAINDTGKLFVGGTNSKYKRCMRVSVCGWQTDIDDVKLSLKAIQQALDLTK